MLFGKLSWDAIPFDQPIPLMASAVVAIAILAVLGWVWLKGHFPYLWREWITSVDHKRIGVMYFAAGDGDAAARLFRRDLMRSQQALAFHVAGLSAAGTLRPDFLRARHDHDLLRRDAVHDRPDEFRRAAAARRPRRRVSDAQFGQLLADRVRRAAGQHLAGDRRIRQDRLAAPIRRCRNCLFAGRRRRLLSMGDPDIGRRHAADRNQFGHDDPENARAGHELYCACRCSAGRRWRPTC